MELKHETLNALERIGLKHKEYSKPHHWFELTEKNIETVYKTLTETLKGYKITKDSFYGRLEAAPITLPGNKTFKHPLIANFRVHGNMVGIHVFDEEKFLEAMKELETT